MPLSKVKKMTIQETLLLLIFHIALPTVDVYTDLVLIFKFLMSGDFIWAGLLSVPFLLNYFLTWILWWRMHKKSLLWISAMLGCYPQFYAANVIKILWADFDRGMKKKRKIERNFSEFEVFAESVFTVLVMTYIWVRASEVGERETVIGQIGSYDESFFFFAYATSILAASFGLAKCLKIGPCRVLGEGGALSGLFTGRFIVLMISAGITLIGKGVLLPIVLYHLDQERERFITKHLWPFVALSFTFLPGLLVALLSLCHYKVFFKTLLSHPSLLLMPVFTHYTFTVNNKSCSKEDETKIGYFRYGRNDKTRKVEEDNNDIKITFSRRWTLINIGVSVVGHVVFGLTSDSFIYYYIPADSFSFYAVLCIPLAGLGILATLIFLFLNHCCGCIPCSPELQVAVLKVNDPLTEYVVHKNKDGVKEIVTMEEWSRRRNGASDTVTGNVMGMDQDGFKDIIMDEWRRRRNQIEENVVDMNTNEAKDTVTRL